MQLIVDKVETRIKKCGRGKLFFATDFASIAGKDSINKSLQRLSERGVIVRYARGIYLYPKKSEFSESGYASPSFAEVAKAVAKRDMARIAPIGDYALNALGLSTQVVMNAVYLTDGSSRKIELVDGRGIRFIHTATRNLAYQSDLMMLVVFAMKELGKGNITAEEYDKIRTTLLENETRENILRDIKLAPAWIADTIHKMIA
ncbi:MAG: DUF6088 family protein [Rikenellaceae bacterium]